MAAVMPFTVKHQRLKLFVDTERQYLEGVTELVVDAPPATTADVRRFGLHARQLSISSVLVDGHPARFELRDVTHVPSRLVPGGSARGSLGASAAAAVAEASRYVKGGAGDPAPVTADVNRGGGQASVTAVAPTGKEKGRGGSSRNRQDSGAVTSTAADAAGLAFLAGRTYAEISDALFHDYAVQLVREREPELVVHLPDAVMARLWEGLPSAVTTTATASAAAATLSNSQVASHELTPTHSADMTSGRGSKGGPTKGKGGDGMVAEGGLLGGAAAAATVKSGKSSEKNKAAAEPSSGMTIRVEYSARGSRPGLSFFPATLADHSALRSFSGGEATAAAAAGVAAAGACCALLAHGDKRCARYWLPCVDLERVRATFDIEVSVPLWDVAVASGQPLEAAVQPPSTDAQGAGPDTTPRAGHVTHHFRVAQPMPTSKLLLFVGPRARCASLLPDVTQFPGTALASHACLMLENAGGAAPLPRGAALGQLVTSPAEARQRHALVGKLAHVTGVLGLALRAYQEWLEEPFPAPALQALFVDDEFVGAASALGAGVAVFGSRLLVDESDIDQNVDTACQLAYAAARMWLGARMNPEHPGDEWLLLGLAGMLVRVFVRKFFGHNEVAYQKCKECEAVCLADGPECGPLYHVAGDEMLHAWMVAENDATLRLWKATNVMSMLEKMMGADNFRKVVQQMMRHPQRGARTISTQQLEKRASKTGGLDKDLVSLFFERWVYGFGSPRLNVGVRYVKKKNTLEVGVHQEVLLGMAVGNARGGGSRRTAPPAAPAAPIDIFLEDLDHPGRVSTVASARLDALLHAPVAIPPGGFLTGWVDAVPLKVHEVDGAFDHMLVLREEPWQLQEVACHSRLAARGKTGKKVGGAGGNDGAASGGKGAGASGGKSGGKPTGSGGGKPAANGGSGNGNNGEDCPTSGGAGGGALGVMGVLDSPLLWLSLDPDKDWLLDVRAAQPERSWVLQLERQRTVAAQLQAIRALSSPPLTSRRGGGGQHSQDPLLACGGWGKDALGEATGFGAVTVASTWPVAGVSPAAINALRACLADAKCFYRVRMEAAMALGACSSKDNDFLGQDHLLHFLRGQYYDPRVGQVRPNNFGAGADVLSSYFVQQAVVSALGMLRDRSGRSPAEVVDVLVDLIKYNDNSGNAYRDDWLLAAEIDALGSLAGLEGRPLAKVLKQIDRQLQRDRLTPSHGLVITCSCMRALVSITLDLGAALEARARRYVWDLLRNFCHPRAHHAVRTQAWIGLCLLHAQGLVPVASDGVPPDAKRGDPWGGNQHAASAPGPHGKSARNSVMETALVMLQEEPSASVICAVFRWLESLACNEGGAGCESSLRGPGGKGGGKVVASASSGRLSALASEGRSVPVLDHSASAPGLASMAEKAPEKALEKAPLPLGVVAALAHMVEGAGRGRDPALRHAAYILLQKLLGRPSNLARLKLFADERVERLGRVGSGVPKLRVKQLLPSVPNAAAATPANIPMPSLKPVIKLKKLASVNASAMPAHEVDDDRRQGPTLSGGWIGSLPSAAEGGGVMLTTSPTRPTASRSMMSLRSSHLRADMGDDGTADVSSRPPLASSSPLLVAGTEAGVMPPPGMCAGKLKTKGRRSKRPRSGSWSRHTPSQGGAQEPSVSGPALSSPTSSFQHEATYPPAVPAWDHGGASSKPPPLDGLAEDGAGTLEGEPLYSPVRWAEEGQAGGAPSVPEAGLALETIGNFARMRRSGAASRVGAGAEAEAGVQVEAEKQDVSMERVPAAEERVMAENEDQAALEALEHELMEAAEQGQRFEADSAVTGGDNTDVAAMRDGEGQALHGAAEDIGFTAAIVGASPGLHTSRYPDKEGAGIGAAGGGAAVDDGAEGGHPDNALAEPPGATPLTEADAARLARKREREETRRLRREKKERKERRRQERLAREEAGGSKKRHRAEGGEVSAQVPGGSRPADSEGGSKDASMGEAPITSHAQLADLPAEESMPAPMTDFPAQLPVVEAQLPVVETPVMAAATAAVETAGSSHPPPRFKVKLKFKTPSADAT